MVNNQQMFIQVLLINLTIIFLEQFINLRAIIQLYQHHLLEILNQIAHFHKL